MSSSFEDFRSVTLGYGAYTLAADLVGAQVLDAHDVALGPKVPLPFDFSELNVSPDGRW